VNTGSLQLSNHIHVIGVTALQDQMPDITLLNVQPDLFLVTLPGLRVV